MCYEDFQLAGFTPKSQWVFEIDILYEDFRYIHVFAFHLPWFIEKLTKSKTLCAKLKPFSEHVSIEGGDCFFEL